MSTSKTNEQALEAAIEKALTGRTSEDVKTTGGGVAEPPTPYGGNGFHMGNPDDFNPKYAIDETRFWHFLEETQKEELEKLQRAADWKLKILERYDRMVKKYGILRILRKGLEVDDAHFTLLYQLPMASSSKAVKDSFANNEFSVTRQVHYNLDNPREEIDITAE